MKHMALYTVVAHGAVHISVRHLHVYGYIHMAIRIAMSTHARKTFCNLRGLVEYPWRCLSSWPPPRAPAGGQPGPQRNTPWAAPENCKVGAAVGFSCPTVPFKIILFIAIDHAVHRGGSLLFMGGARKLQGRNRFVKRLLRCHDLKDGSLNFWVGELWVVSAKNSESVPQFSVPMVHR